MKLELSDMLANAKADPPPLRYSVEDAIAAGRKRQRRLRAAWAGAGSAAVVVAVAAAVAMPQVIPDRRPVGPAPVAPAASPVPTQRVSFEYPADEYTGNIASFTVGNLTVTGTVHMTPGYQVAVVVAQGRGTPIEDENGTTHQMPNDVGNVVVYRAGVFDPAQFESGEPVSINGAHGYYRAPVKVKPTASNLKFPAQARQVNPALAWEYADNAWAVVSTNANAEITKQQLIAVAGKLTSSTPAPVKVGFRLTYVPAGFNLAAAGTSDSNLLSPLEGESYVRLVKGDFAYKGLTEPARDMFLVGKKQLPLIQIAIYPKWYSKYVAPRGEPVSAAFCGADSLCYRVTSNGEYDVEVNGGGAVPDAELLKMLKMLKFADPGDPGTWLTATDAVG